MSDDADRDEEAKKKQKLEDWAREEQQKKLKDKEYKQKFKERHPGRTNEYQAKWRENTKKKREEQKAEAKASGYTLNMASVAASGAASGEVSSTVAVVPRAVNSVNSVLGSDYDTVLSVQQMSSKKLIGGNRALCRGECHWDECWMCMRFFVPDRDVRDHPYFMRGLGVRPPKNVGREIEDDYFCREYTCTLGSQVARGPFMQMMEYDE